MSAASAQLRTLLAEKFPGIKMRLGEPGTAAEHEHAWPLDLAQRNAAWPATLPKGVLTEVVALGNNSGSACLMQSLLDCAARENQIIALIDGSDSLDVTQIEPPILARLLWVRCRSTAEAVKAVDLVLRDRNFSLVLLDLKLNSAAQLRKIPANVWYRLQRLIEKTATVCVVFTPQILVSSTRRRLTLQAAGEIFTGTE